MRMKLKLFAQGLLTSFLLAFGMAASADDFPAKPVSVVVPFSPGGSVDPSVRVVAEAMSRLAPQPFVVENKGGAGGAVGARYVAKAEGDGYTLLASSNAMVVSQAMYKSLPWDVGKSFSYIGNFGSIPLAIFVNAKNADVKTLTGLVDLSHNTPQELTYGTAGIGSSAHLAGELLQKHLNIHLLHIPFTGAGAASTGLLGGSVDVMISGLPAAGSLLQDENIRLIAITASERATQRPETPTVAEDLPGFDFSVWVGLAAPSSTSPEKIARLAEWMKEAVAMADVNQKLLDFGLSPKFEAGDEVLERAYNELQSFNQTIDAAGIERR